MTFATYCNDCDLNGACERQTLDDVENCVKRGEERRKMKANEKAREWGNCQDCIFYPENPSTEYCIPNKSIPKIGNITVCKYRYKYEHSRQEDEKKMIEIVKKYFDCFHCTWEKSCKNGKIDCSVKDKIIKSMKSHYGGSK